MNLSDEERELILKTRQKKEKEAEQIVRKNREEQESLIRENSIYYDASRNSFVIFERAKGWSVAERYVIEIPKTYATEQRMPRVYRNRDGLSSAGLSEDVELEGLERCPNGLEQVKAHYTKCMHWASATVERLEEYGSLLKQVEDWIEHAKVKRKILFGKRE